MGRPLIMVHTNLGNLKLPYKFDKEGVYVLFLLIWFIILETPVAEILYIVHCNAQFKINSKY